MLLKVLKTLINHPLNRNRKVRTISRFLFWQIINKLGVKSLVFDFTKNSKLKMYKGLSAATGNYYSGLLEYHDMAFLLHLLKENDIFFDIGANVGSYSILASAECKANVMAFEPIPKTFSYLKENIELNNLVSKVQANNFALGNAQGKISFTYSNDAANHVALPEETEVIDIDIVKLNDLSIPGIPTLIKIDVEGFEMNVLKGSSNILEKQELLAIIIEINGLCNKYGTSESEINNYIVSFGFKPYYYEPKLKTFTIREDITGFNCIYIRNMDKVNNRIQSSPKYYVQGKEI
ncbi:MAG: FkbM family methyltransferase [Saprospiraceae bacterium]|nr:FkbM family methyltransferase [Saprospiraceae bacterium]